MAYADLVTAEASLVSYWRLAGNAADEKNVNNGTIVGGVTRANGLLVRDQNECGDFDGSTGYVEIPDSASLDVTSFTIEGLVNLDVAPTTARRLFQKEAAYELYAGGYGASDSFAVGRFSGATASRVAAAVSPVAGRTYHLVGTYDQAALKIYVNGELSAESAVTGAVDASTGKASIGCRVDLVGGTSEFVNGRIDEVAVYNTALSAATILSHYEEALKLLPGRMLLGVGG